MLDAKTHEQATREALARIEPDTSSTALLHIERIQGAGRIDGRGRVHTYQGAVALADSLSAFLADGGPCDELAVRSALGSGGPTLLPMLLRNRLTNASIGGRQ